MSPTKASSSKSGSDVDYDVLVMGAGISGICAAYHLKHETNKSFVVLEAKAAMGGTWDTFKYQGM